MKYWNKSKKARLAHWTAVERPVQWSTFRATTGVWVGARVALPELQCIEEMKLWCQRQPSKGRFYFKDNKTTWWFEHGKDATWFLLNWSSHG